MCSTAVQHRDTLQQDAPLWSLGGAAWIQAGGMQMGSLDHTPLLASM